MARSLLTTIRGCDIWQEELPASRFRIIATSNAGVVYVEHVVECAGNAIAEASEQAVAAVEAIQAEMPPENQET